MRRAQRRAALITLVIGAVIVVVWTVWAVVLVRSTQPEYAEDAPFGERIGESVADDTRDTAIWFVWFVGLAVIVGFVLSIAHRKLTRGAGVRNRED